MDSKIKVLYVDDEENNLMSFKACFRIKYDVFIAISAKVALEILEKNEDIQVVITDQRMPEITGVEFLKMMLDQHPKPMRIMLTGFANFADTVDAVNLGKIFSYLNKPWEEKILDETIQKAISKYAEEEFIRQRAQQTERAERSAEQMEFILRQELLS
ncbi:MAG: two-component system response regulator [Bacteroidetes bacterium B1(2017)]|nr:MAG: two-component system response regulator [Bacteroidetes bacterium B1(2017)]